MVSAAYAVGALAETSKNSVAAMVEMLNNPRRLPGRVTAAGSRGKVKCFVMTKLPFWPVLASRFLH